MSKNARGRQDIVLDMDRLYEAITLLPRYDKPESLYRVVRWCLQPPAGQRENTNRKVADRPG